MASLVLIFDQGVNLLSCGIQRDPERGECAGGEGALMTKESSQQVTAAERGASGRAGLLQGVGDRLAGVVGHPFQQRIGRALPQTSSAPVRSRFDVQPPIASRMRVG